MPKKNTVKPFHPRRCLESLTEYQDRVFSLYMNVKAALRSDQITGNAKELLDDDVEKIAEFFNYNEQDD